MHTTLNSLYPDIQDELCNRHSTNLTKITHKFEYLYSKSTHPLILDKPSLFIVAKGLC